MAEVVLTKDTFEEEVVKSDKPVLVDFWAVWCGPCRMIAPYVEEIAEEYADTLKVGKINVDEEPELAAAFGIDSIPTLILFRDGKPVKKTVGYTNKNGLETFLGL